MSIDLAGDIWIPAIRTKENFLKENSEMFLNEYDIICLVEGRTKEQQEKGQREMAKQALEPLYIIKEFFLKRWYSGRNVKRNALEKTRYNEILKSLKSIQMHKDIREYVKNVTGKDPESCSMGKYFQNCLVELARGVPVIGLDREEHEYANGIKFNLNSKQMRKNVRQFIILHEYGHLFDYFKHYIITGKYKITGTFGGKKEEITDSESSANNYALKNMYRKDRRELLKNSDLSKEKIEDAKRDLNDPKGYHLGSTYLAKVNYFNY